MKSYGIHVERFSVQDLPDIEDLDEDEAVSLKRRV